MRASGRSGTSWSAQVDTGDDAGGIGVLELGGIDGVGQGRVGIAVDLAGVAGRDGECRFVHRERARGQRDVVVGGVAAAAGDGVGAGSGAGAGRCAQVDAANDAGGVGVPELRGVDRVGQGRVGVAIGLALVVRGDGEGGLVHGQHAVDQAHVVVGGGAGRAADGVGAGGGAGAGGGTQVDATDDRRGVGVFQLCGIDGVGEGRVGIAVGLALRVSGEGERRLVHGERAGDEAEVVVGGGAAGGTDRVCARRGRAAGGRAQHDAADDAVAVRVFQLRGVDGVRQGRLDIAVGLALCVSGDGERGLVDGERVVGEGEVVVGRGATGGRDGVGAGRGAGAGGGGQDHAAHHTGRVRVLQLGRVDAVGQGRIRIAVGLACGVGGDGERSLVDGERVVGEGQRVVGGRAAAGGDGVGASRGTGAGGGGQGDAADDAVAVRVFQLRGVDGVRQGRLDIAVGLALCVSGDGERGLVDGERVVGEGEVVVGRGATGGRDGVGAGRGAGAGGGGQDHAAHHTGRVRVLQLGRVDAVGQGRIRIAVGLACGVGGDGERSLVDGERVVGEGQRVVGGRAAAGGDGVGAGRGTGAGGRGQIDAADDAVAVRVLQLRRVDGVGQARVGVAIGLACGVGGDGEGGLGDGQRASRELAELVVAAGDGEAALGDGMGASRGAGARGGGQQAGQHAGLRVAADEPLAAHADGQGRIGVAIGLGLRFGFEVEAAGRDRGCGGHGRQAVVVGARAGQAQASDRDRLAGAGVGVREGAGGGARDRHGVAGDVTSVGGGGCARGEGGVAGQRGGRGGVVDPVGGGQAGGGQGLGRDGHGLLAVDERVVARLGAAERDAAELHGGGRGDVGVVVGAGGAAAEAERVAVVRAAIAGRARARGFGRRQRGRAGDGRRGVAVVDLGGRCVQPAQGERLGRDVGGDGAGADGVVGRVGASQADPGQGHAPGGAGVPVGEGAGGGAAHADGVAGHRAAVAGGGAAALQRRGAADGGGGRAVVDLAVGAQTRQRDGLGLHGERAGTRRDGDGVAQAVGQRPLAGQGQRVGARGDEAGVRRGVAAQAGGQAAGRGRGQGVPVDQAACRDAGRRG